MDDLSRRRRETTTKMIMATMSRSSPAAPPARPAMSAICGSPELPTGDVRAVVVDESFVNCKGSCESEVVVVELVDDATDVSGAKVVVVDSAADAIVVVVGDTFVVSEDDSVNLNVVESTVTVGVGDLMVMLTRGSGVVEGTMRRFVVAMQVLLMHRHCGGDDVQLKQFVSPFD